jgi:large subunit ribosomal protein L17
MRHGVKGRKLGRTSSHREALFRNQLQSLMENERIITTLPKAKELRPLAERVITRGKDDSVHSRRWALRWLLRRDLVKKVFDEISPRFRERPGGYLRIVKLGPRQGDGAEMAVIEMVDFEFSTDGKDAKDTAAPKGSRSKKDKGGEEKVDKTEIVAEKGAKPKAAKPKKPKATATGKLPSEGKPKKESRADGKRAGAAPVGRKTTTPRKTV